MAKVKKVQKNLAKTVAIILGIIFAAVLICNIAYITYFNIERKSAQRELDAAVDTAVSDCIDLLNSFGMTDKQKEYIDLFNQNMANAQTSLQRAYYANAMLTYAVSSANLENSNNLTSTYNNGSSVQSKEHIVTELNTAAQTLRNAIYDYTLYEED